MQASESRLEGRIVKAELAKESFAERLEYLADNLDLQGNALADRLRDIEGRGIGVVSGGIRRTAEVVRRASVPGIIMPSDEKRKAPAVPIAIGLGAGLFMGLIVRKMIR